ncbi:MAG: LacI family DNA-binding transcriptional regulator [Clostridia bacterium]
MVTIKEVAKHANVSVSTVSKVMKDYKNISVDTRKRVRKAIEELDYSPNTAASALSSKEGGRVAILMDLTAQSQVIDEISMRYLHGAIRSGKAIGLDIITVFFSMIEDKSLREIERYFKLQQISGIIIYGLNKEHKTLHKLIESKRFKVVVVDAPFVNDNTSSVQIDNKNAQIDVARKTISYQGSKKILYIKGRENSYSSDERLQGINELCNELDVSCTVVDGKFSELEARQITFDNAQDFEVIVCASDLMAIGAMKALIEMDIFRRVCGFDGIKLMGYIGKGMDTVRQDFYSIAEHSVNEIDRLLKGEGGRAVVVPHMLERLDYIDVIK